MSGKALPHSLRAEMEWAIQTVTACGSPSPDNLDMIRRAIRSETPMLSKRFNLFLDNSTPWDLEKEDQNRLGALILALEAHTAGQPWRLYQPGEWAPEREARKRTVIQFRCPDTFKARLQAYCQRTGSDLSSLIRAAVETHLENNPLWKGLSPGDP